jgi:ubiquinone biosynthesis monooxygenase Coq7
MSTSPFLTPLDRCLSALGRIIELSFTSPCAKRSMPIPTSPEPLDTLSAQQAAYSAQLIRVNHAGEVCAQALYDGQAWVAQETKTRDWLMNAAQDESDHLQWCHQRLEELGSRPSYFNPLWYVGSFTLGAVLGKLSDGISLGFVNATEHQVAQHLSDHLEKLPEADQRSRVLLQQMLIDETHHADTALQHGGMVLPQWFETVLRICAKTMTTLAKWV